MSEFARKQLEKYGWSEGKGLGKDETGIVNPIKVKMKFDNQGIGHDSVKKWTSAWWCDMFNDASKRITVKNCETGVQFSSKKRTSEANSSSPALVHKRFVKGDTLEKSAEKLNKAENELEDNCSVISDSIFKMCEGTRKTCFNYGLMKGKIKRVRKQEALFEQENKKKKKSKKKKKYQYE